MENILLVFANLLETGKPRHYENEILLKNGETRTIIWSNTRLSDNDGNVNGALSIGQDITEHILLKKEIGHSEQLAVLGQLAAGLAHEVGNPLTSISSIVQILQRKLKDASVLEKLNMIRGQTRRITQIIRDLVDFSRPSESEEELTDINVQIEKAVRIVRLDEKSKNAEFVSDLADDMPNIVLIEDQLFQVILNLLINSIDALENRNGIITIRTAVEKNNLKIEINDDGIGIPVKYLDRIFDPFFTTKEVGKGTGLGLWVSSGIIDSFGGTIEVESKENVGTKFSITLPIEG